MNFAAPIDYPALLGALVVLNWPVYRALWAVAFEDAAEAKNSFFYLYLRPYVWSILRGELWKHWERSSKAALFMITTLVILCMEYAALASLIDLFAKRGNG